MIILLTGYFSLAFHRLFLTAVVFTLCGDPLPKGFSYLQGWIKPYVDIVHVVVTVIMWMNGFETFVLTS